MREVVDKIGAQHLRVLQLCGHGVEAVGDLADGAVAAERAVEIQPRAIVAAGQAVERVDDLVDRLERQHAHRAGQHRADHHAGEHQRRRVEVGDERTVADVQHTRVVEDHDHGADQHARDCQQHENNQREEHGEREAMLFCVEIHPCFTAL